MHCKLYLDAIFVYKTIMSRILAANENAGIFVIAFHWARHVASSFLPVTDELLLCLYNIYIQYT